MKKIFYPVVFLLMLYQSAASQFTKALLRADGVTCSLCSKAIDKQLHKIDFIDSTITDIDNAGFVLYFNKDKVVDFDKIKKGVEDAGFSVGMLKATFNFNNRLMDTNSCFNYQNSIFCFLDVSPRVLNGEVTLQIIDKGFIPNKEYAKYAAKLAAHKTNRGLRVYHIIL